MRDADDPVKKEALSHWLAHCLFAVLPGPLCCVTWAVQTCSPVLGDHYY